MNPILIQKALLNSKCKSGDSSSVASNYGNTNGEKMLFE